MSLINDALRRANSDRSRGPQSSAPVPPIEPVEPPASPRILPWAVLVLGVGVVAIGAALWFRSPGAPQIAGNEPAPASSSAPATPAAALPVETPPQPSPVTTAPEVARTDPQITQQPQTFAGAPGSAAERTKISSEQPAIPASPLSTAPAVAAAAKPPEPEAVAPAETRPSEVPVVAAAPATPETTTVSAEPRQTQAPRLQAIYYRFRKPTVVINGKTLSPGDSADGIRVVSIQRSSVEVVQNGKYRTLTLQD